MTTRQATKSVLQVAQDSHNETYVRCDFYASN